MTFSINYGSKRGLNLTKHISGLKNGERPGKIWINRYDILEISKWDIFFAHPLYSFPHSDITRVIPVKVKPFMAQQFLIPNVPKILACCIFLKFLNFLGFWASVSYKIVSEDVVVGTPQSGPVIRSAADCLLMLAHMDLLMSLRLIHDRTDKLCLR